MRDAFVAALMEAAEADPRVMILTGDLGFGVLTKFRDRFPRQFINVGVAEQNMTGLATGLALEGRVVFTYSIANFATMRCLEHIRNDAAYHDANVKVVSVGGGFSYGPLGISHHATEDLAILRSLPAMTVVAPCGLWEVRQATHALIRQPGTAFLRLDKSHAPVDPAPGEEFVLGRIRTVRAGTAITLAATGGILAEALNAATALAAAGIECRVLSVSTIKPLDVQTLRAASVETGGIVTVEEHTVDGGLGGAVAEALLESGCAPRVFHRIGLRAGFSSIVGSQEYLRTAYGMDAAAIEAKVRELLGKRP